MIAFLPDRQADGPRLPRRSPIHSPKRVLKVVGGRRGLDAVNRRERILDVAAQLLVSDEDQLSMRKLAAEAGVSVTTIYNLVGSQESILIALVGRPAYRPAVMYDAATDPRPLETLFAEVQAFATAINHDQGAVLPAARALMHLGFERLRLNISPVIESFFLPPLRRAAALGHLRDGVPPEFLANRLAALGVQAMLDWASGIGGYADFRRRCIGDFILIVLAGIADSQRSEWEARLGELTPGGSPSTVRLASGNNGESFALHNPPD
jgi:AcrR family transcriptional regulator